MSDVTNYSQWDKDGEKLYQLGVDRAMIYDYGTTTASPTVPIYHDGVAFSGVTNFNTSIEGGDVNDQWADNQKYASIRGNEDFKFTIECFHYPDLFAKMNGERGVDADNNPGATGAMIFAGQGRPTFGFCCRTNIGDDVNGTESGYYLHLCYGCSTNPSDADYETVNDSPEGITFSFEVSTIPVQIGDTLLAIDSTLKPMAHLKIKVTNALKTSAGVKALEKALYGYTTGEGSSAVVTPGRLPLPAEVYTLLSATS